MKCSSCKYQYATSIKIKEEELFCCSCGITHRIDVESCDYIENDEEVENMNICYNCKQWIGGGDWGLGCAKNYYNCSTNGFDEACEQFERKNL